MQPQPTTSHWKWLVPTALGTAGLVAIARRKRKRNTANHTKRTGRDRRTYWQQRTIPPGDRPLCIEALARIIASEAGTQPEAIKRAVAWMARNRASLIQRPLGELGAPRGQWGSIAVDRPFATDQPPTAIERTLAELILGTAQHRDPTDGATHGFNRRTQDQLADRSNGARDSETVIRIWTQHYGLAAVKEIGPWTFYR